MPNRLADEASLPCLADDWEQRLQRRTVDPLLANSGEVLAPRVSEQFEIGAKYAIGRMFASLALYQIERPGEGVIAAAKEIRTNDVSELEPIAKAQQG